MRIPGGRAWPRRIAAWVTGLAVGMLVAATSLAPPPVDDAMVERAVAGAEWLAARAEEASSEQVEKAADAPDLTNWLLAVGTASDPGYEAFTAHLVEIGYGDPLFAIHSWLEEFPRVLAAAKAARRPGDVRTVEEIQAEIRALPTVPLDAAGRRERDRLIDELILTAVPKDERQAAGRAGDRIAALQALFERESDQ